MGLLKENERSANKAAAKVMRITVLVFAFVLILDILGIFIVKLNTMIAAFVVGSIILLIPTILVNVLKRNDSFVKYIIVVCAIAFTTIATITLSWHAVLLYVYPIAIASLYFSGKLNIFTVVLTIIGVSLGQLIAFKYNFVVDDNLYDLKRTLIFGIVPRALVLFAVSAIFTMLCKRTAAMLGNLMGAEQQRIMREKSLEVSEKLLGTVIELDKISTSTSNANKSIANRSENVMRDSEANFEHIKVVEHNMNLISENLKNLSEMSEKISVLATKADELTNDNNQKMAVAAESMDGIFKSTEESREIIEKLSEQSKKIEAIAKVITDVSMQTNILALNASVEAARAGENGKGFSVVASEIKKLSGETETAANEIGEIIEEVTLNISGTVKAMEKNSELTRNGMESMKKVKASAEQISSSNREISNYINNMNDVIGNVAENGENVSQKLVSVSGNIENNCGAVQHVAAAIEENTAGTESLGFMVKDIKKMAIELEQLTK